jgi:hypothetical protein
MNLNGATITLTFDDLTMKLTRIEANNPTNRTLTFAITNPITWNRTINAGGTLSVNLPSNQRPSYVMNYILKEDGITMLASMGISFGAKL